MDFKNYQLYFLLAFLGGTLYLVFSLVRPFMYALILAMAFAWAIQPLYQWILRQLRGHRGWAALATMIITIILVLIPLVFLGFQVFREVNHVYTSLEVNKNSNLLAFAQSRINTIKQWFPILGDTSGDPAQYVKQAAGWLASNLGVIFSSFIAGALNLLIFLFGLFYFLKDGPRLKKAVMAMSPLDGSDNEAILAKIQKSVDSVLRGSLIIALAQGLLAILGFFVFGVPNAVLWGSLVMVAALVPGIGTALVLAPAILFLFLNGQTLSAMGLLIWGISAVGLIDNFLGPKLMGHGAALHPFLMMLAVLGGIGLFGPVGIILGPILMALLLALMDIYSHITAKQH